MKTLVKYKFPKMVDGREVQMETIQAFNSILEFETFLKQPEGLLVYDASILTAEEIEEFLVPLKAAVIIADLRKADAKKILEDCSVANKALFDITGPDYMFQDSDLTVYKTDVCDGKFVYFDPVEIKRTRREGEAKGTLSMKEAESAGFKLAEKK